MNKLKALLLSRKFWAMLGGLTFLYLGPRAGVTEEQLQLGVGIIVTYIGGTALEGMRAQG